MTHDPDTLRHARTVILGRLGRGPSTLTDFRAELYRSGMRFEDACEIVGQCVGDLASSGHAECKDTPTGKCWTLAGSVAFETSSKEILANSTEATRPGFISADAFRRSGRK